LLMADTREAMLRAQRVAEAEPSTVRSPRSSDA